MQYGSNDAESYKDMPFEDVQDDQPHLRGHIPQNPQNVTWLTW